MTHPKEATKIGQRSLNLRRNHTAICDQACECQKCLFRSKERHIGVLLLFCLLNLDLADGDLSRLSLARVLCSITIQYYLLVHHHFKSS